MRIIRLTIAVVMRANVDDWDKMIRSQAEKVRGRAASSDLIVVVVAVREWLCVHFAPFLSAYCA